MQFDGVNPNFLRNKEDISIRQSEVHLDVVPPLILKTELIKKKKSEVSATKLEIIRLRASAFGLAAIGVLLAPLSFTVGPILGFIRGAFELYQIGQTPIGIEEGVRRNLKKDTLKNCVKAGAIGYFILAQKKWGKAKTEQAILEDKLKISDQPPQKMIEEDIASVRGKIIAIRSETEKEIAGVKQSAESKKKKIKQEAEDSKPLLFLEEENFQKDTKIETEIKVIGKKMEQDIENIDKKSNLDIKRLESQRDEKINELKSIINELKSQRSNSSQLIKLREKQSKLAEETKKAIKKIDQEIKEIKQKVKKMIGPVAWQWQDSEKAEEVTKLTEMQTQLVNLTKQRIKLKSQSESEIAKLQSEQDKLQKRINTLRGHGK